MSDGYIQSKQRELNDKLISIEEKSRLLDLQMEKIDEKIGGYHTLLNKINDIEKYKKSLEQENEKKIESFLNKRKQEIHDIIVRIVSSHMKKMVKKVKDFSEITNATRKREKTLSNNLIICMKVYVETLYLLQRKGYFTRTECLSLLEKVGDKKIRGKIDNEFKVTNAKKNRYLVLRAVFERPMSFTDLTHETGLRNTLLLNSLKSLFSSNAIKSAIVHPQELKKIGLPKKSFPKNTPKKMKNYFITKNGRKKLAYYEYKHQFYKEFPNEPYYEAIQEIIEENNYFRKN